MKDIKKLELLYEETCSKNTDFLLLENIDNFDYNYFWKLFIINDQNYYPLYEKFELIKTEGNSDIYEIETTNALKFSLYVNYLNKSDLDNKLISMYASNINDKKIIKEIMDIVKNTKLPILNVNFKDEPNNIKLTGNVGNYTFSVINGIKNAISQSLYNRGDFLPDVLMFYILKSETRKLQFLEMFFGKMFNKFKNKYVDASNNEYNIIYFYI